MGQSKLVQGHAGSFWHTKEINIDLMNFNCCITRKGHPPLSLIQNCSSFILQQSHISFGKCTLHEKTDSCSKPVSQRVTVIESLRTTWSPVPIYLQVIWNEDFASFLNHRLWFQLFFRELALTRVKHLLAGNTGKSKICRVRFVANRNLDSLRINGTWCVSVCWQDLSYRNKASVQLCEKKICK